MSQISSFYLLNGSQREELSNGNCDGAVYMAIWDYCEEELDLDVRINAPQTEETADCVLIDRKMAKEILTAFQEKELPRLAAELAQDWDLLIEALEDGLETLISHLKRVQSDTVLLYEMV